MIALGTRAGAQRTDPQQEASNLMSDLIQRMGQQNSDPQAQFEWVVQQPQVPPTCPQTIQALRCT